MSYATYLQNKLAAERKVVKVQNPMDASHYTHKKRLEANHVFFAGGQGVGTLARMTTRSDGTPLLSHPAVSFSKPSTRPADASDYTSFRGAQGIRDDAPYVAGGQKEIPCCDMPVVDGTKYKTAADATRDKLACDTTNALRDPPRFVDNTVRLSAMVPEMVTGGCCDNSFVDANHTHSEGIHPPVRPSAAITQHTFMAAPPEFQNKGVGGKRAGAYYNPRSGYVENKHGNDLRVNPRRVPTKFVLDPHAPAHLKINDPTFANVKP